MPPILIRHYLPGNDVGLIVTSFRRSFSEENKDFDKTLQDKTLQLLGEFRTRNWAYGKGIIPLR